MPPPWDPTPCYLNQFTCHNHYNDTGMGRNIDVTYDWKHLIYEDYDRWLFNKLATHLVACSTSLASAGYRAAPSTCWRLVNFALRRAHRQCDT